MISQSTCLWKVSAYSVLVMFLATCRDEEKEANQSIIRPVYSGYELGMPITKAIGHKLANQLSGNYKSKMIDGKKLTYEAHQTSKGEKYYSTVVLIVPPADTMLLGLKLVYSVTDEGDLAQSQTENGEDVLLLMPENNNYISDYNLKEDLVEKISNSYGQYDRIDTIPSKDVEEFLVYKWLNRNGVNVTLKYEWNNLPVNSIINYFYSIVVKYEYADEMMRKIKYRKSKY